MAARLVRASRRSTRRARRDLSFLASARYLDAFQGSRAGVRPASPTDFAAVAGGPADPGRRGGSGPGAWRRWWRGSTRQPAPAPGVDPTARLAPGVRLWARTSAVGASCRPGAERPSRGPGPGWARGTVIEDGVEIGDDTVLGPRVVCGSGTRIGQRVRIKAGAVLGGTGFGYVSGREGHRPGAARRRGASSRTTWTSAPTPAIDRGSVDDTVVGQRHQDRQPGAGRSQCPDRPAAAC